MAQYAIAFDLDTRAMRGAGLGEQLAKLLKGQV